MIKINRTIAVLTTAMAVGGAMFATNAFAADPPIDPWYCMSHIQSTWTKTVNAECRNLKATSQGLTNPRRVAAYSTNGSYFPWGFGLRGRGTDKDLHSKCWTAASTGATVFSATCPDDAVYHYVKIIEYYAP